MELNVSNIIGAYPIGTPVYSPAYGDCSFKGLEENGLINLKAILSGEDITLSEDGILAEGGELMVYPSREMRSWEKFAFKKGDILWYAYIGNCVFESWANDQYTEFYGRYLRYFTDNGNKDRRKMPTSMWSKICTKKQELEYLAEIERRYGGKLNRDTLEFEKQNKQKAGNG